MDLPRSLHAQLDKFQLQLLESARIVTDGSDAREIQLQAIVRSFDRPPRLEKLSSILIDYHFSRVADDEHDGTEWLILARASIVVVESMLRELFARALPLSQDILYWEQLLSSRLWRTLFAIQTAPTRFWDFSSTLYQKSRELLKQRDLTLGALRNSVLNPALIRRVVFPHLNSERGANATRFLSLDAVIRQEVNSKKLELLCIRDRQAQALGLLVAEARFGCVEDLRGDVQSLVEMLRSLSQQTSQPGLMSDEKIHAIVKKSTDSAGSPSMVANKLLNICDSFSYNKQLFDETIVASSRPSRLVRFWPVALGIYFSGSSFLRYISSRRQELSTWIHETLETAKSFWTNWIIEPVSNILATIRHDEGSEVALLSKRSLAADMESLERMVVEFAQDNPQFAASSDLEVLKSSAREGDLTPVLVAYENNIKSPLRNAITGSLVRSLLIQVQKTKVDVEVAINGIDKLLKSQELVFGFVGVSPAIAILWGLVRWISSARGRRGQIGSGQIKITTIKTLRNIDRMLCKSSEEEDNMSYRTKGLILCEVQVLRLCATSISNQLRDQYLEDLSDLERGETSKTVRRILKRVIRTYSGSLAI